MFDQDEMTVFYDGDCPVCAAAAESWQPGAGSRGLKVIALQDAPDRDGGPTDEDLREAIHVHAKGGWLRGARALLAVYRRLGNRPMTMLLSLGVALGVADPIYNLVARNRMHIPILRRKRRA